MELLVKEVGFGLMLVIAMAIYAVPLAVLYGVYWLLSLPLRRRERARLFLDLLELGMEDDHSPERAIIEAAGSNDAALGARFHLLASHLQGGARLNQALHKILPLVPSQVSAILALETKLG